MMWRAAAVAVAVVAAVSWVPLRGPRRIAVVALRLAALGCLLLSLGGVSWVRRHERGRQIVYLVDQSASIEAAQTAWIAKRLASLEAIRPPQVSRAVIAFGEHAQAVFPDDHRALIDPSTIHAALEASPIGRDGTNLEAALLAGLSASAGEEALGGFAKPPQEHRRVILFSDGRPTEGQLERVLPHLRRFGLEVYPVTVPSAKTSGLVWERLDVPPVVQRGASIPAKLVFSNATQQAQAVEIIASLEGVPLVRRRYVVHPGWAVVTVPVPTVKTGTMPFEISVVLPQESAPQQRKTVVEVQGPPRVLWIAQQPHELPLLASALKRRDVDMAVMTPAELPGQVGQLLDYDVVLLDQIPKSSLGAMQVHALDEYVERFGGGVLMVGLGGNLKEELAHAAPLDALLPVRFEPKGVQEAQRRVCMVMLIDRSASMLGPRIAATKRAAVALVKQLAPEDLVGVFAFDTIPYVLSEVQRAELAKANLVDKLARLKATGGTDIFPALKIAQQRLLASGATVKHIILLSDGQTPMHAEEYRNLLGECTQQQITISTIGIGSMMINTDYLGWLAAQTGGTFYQMQSMDELPQLIARDTEKATGKLPFTEGSFRPVRAEMSEWFSEVTDWPPLKGYLTTTAKPDARIELRLRQADSEEAIVADWGRGLGHVTVFASDADTRWCPEWIRWPRFDVVWAEMVRRTMRPRPTEELFVSLDEQRGLPQVVIEGEFPHANPAAELIAPDREGSLPLALVQQNRMRWSASVEHVPEGWYELAIRSASPPQSMKPSAQSSDSPVRQEASNVSPPEMVMTRWIHIGHQPAGPERSHLPPDEALLGRIAQVTDGVMDAPDRAFLPPTEWVEQPSSLRAWLLGFVVLFLLMEVALRGRTLL